MVNSVIDMLRQKDQVEIFLSLLDELANPREVDLKTKAKKKQLEDQETSLQEQKQQQKDDKADLLTKIQDDHQSQIAKAYVEMGVRYQAFVKLETEVKQQTQNSSLSKLEEDLQQPTTRENNNNSTLPTSAFIMELNEAVQKAKNEFEVAKNKYQELAALREEAQRSAAKPYDDKIKEIDKKLDEIRNQKDLLPGSLGAETRLAEATRDALTSIPPHTKLSPEAGDRIFKSLEKKPDLLDTLLKSSVAVDAISRSSSFNQFYENLMAKKDITDRAAMKTISTLAPRYSGNQQEIDFQQSLKAIGSVFQEIQNYANKKNESNKTDRLTDDRVQQLQNFIRSLNRPVAYSKLIDDYHVANGAVIVLQNQIAQKEVEAQVIYDRVRENGLDDTWFEELDSIQNSLFKLNTRLATEQTNALNAKKGLTDFIEQSSRVAKAYHDAKNSKDPEAVLHKHHFFSKKRFSETTPLQLLKKLAVAMETAKGKTLAVDEQNMNQQVEITSNNQRRTRG